MASGTSDDDGETSGTEATEEAAPELSGDPELVDAIEKNRELQTKLQALLVSVDKALEENSKTQAMVSGLKAMKRPRGGQSAG